MNTSETRRMALWAAIAGLVMAICLIVISVGTLVVSVQFYEETTPLPYGGQEICVSTLCCLVPLIIVILSGSGIFFITSPPPSEDNSAVG